MASEPDLTDPENPEWTDATFARARPAAQMLPTVLFAELTKPRGRPHAEKPKRQVTLRLDPDVIDHFRAGGRGWQSRINEALRRALPG